MKTLQSSNGETEQEDGGAQNGLKATVGALIAYIIVAFFSFFINCTFIVVIKSHLSKFVIVSLSLEGVLALIVLICALSAITGSSSEESSTTPQQLMSLVDGCMDTYQKRSNTPLNNQTSEESSEISTSSAISAIVLSLLVLVKIAVIALISRKVKYYQSIVKLEPKRSTNYSH